MFLRAAEREQNSAIDDTDDDGTSTECRYSDWTEWSDCEVVCQPVRRGSNKVRQRYPLDRHESHCQVIEELFYCDPSIYC